MLHGHLMFNKYSNMEGADQEYENELEHLTYKMMALTTGNELEKKAVFLKAASNNIISAFREIKDREKLSLEKILEKLKKNYFEKSLKEKLEKASSKMVKMLFTMRQGLKQPLMEFINQLIDNSED